MSKLYLVPTPIGNLKDITLRAIETLNLADAILAEDTRTTAKLLSHYQIKKELISYHQFNEHGILERIMQLLLSGKTLALVSDAGTPGISDPGFLIVRECLTREIAIECLPGATALIPALVNSGLPCDRFCFEGFLPRKKGRQSHLQELAEEKRTLVFYESPFRLVKTLEQLATFLGGDRRASVSRELSKLHEENARGTLHTLIDHFKSKTVKGEVVLVVEGKGKS